MPGMVKGLGCLIVLSSFGCLAGAYWHAYDVNKNYTQCSIHSADERQTELKRQTKSVALEKKEKWKLWPNIVSERDILDGETMYGFEDGMEAIWKNQHPEDCSKAQFLIGGGFESGFGSEFHVLGAGLALAMKMNRVYIMLATNGDSSLMDKMHSNNRFQVDIDYCRHQNKTNLDCYFEPWSSCTLDDALKGTTLQTLRLNNLMIPFTRMAREEHTERTLIVHLSPELRDEIPPSLQQMLECSPLNVGKYRYWWRSLAAAYMLRPNEATRQLIMQHRQDKEMAFDFNKEQCVSVHIRRGDKHLEMEVINDEKVFYDMAQTLWSDVKNSTHSTQEKGIMFVGSEDAGVFDTASAWAAANNFEVKYSNLFDRKQVTTGLNNEQQQEARKKNAFVHHEWEYFNMILTLDGHLRCSAFVCTHRSNYCRVIDELRATVGHKANKQYADFTCNPPCIDSPRTAIDWRRL